MIQALNPPPAGLTPEAKGKVHFPGLNSLRAIAALFVVVSHIEFVKSKLGIPNHEAAYFLNLGGRMSVILFFVLSGFLITYLLLAEQQKYGTIHVRKFYIRRILRIWPIYFLLTAIGFTVYAYWNHISSIHIFILQILLFVFFLPHLNQSISTQFGFHKIDYINHLWSIGVEEQFYFFWPIILKYFHKQLLTVLLIIFSGFTILPFFYFFIYNHYLKSAIDEIHVHQIIVNFIYCIRFNVMALGGIGAYLYFNHKRRILNFLYSRWVEVPAALGGAIIWISGYKFPILNDEIYALFFLIIILNTATNPRPIIHLRYKLSEWLGQLSYGIYVYHLIVMYFMVKMINSIWMIQDTVLWSIVIALISMGVTVAIAYASYHLIELPFLRWKNRFALIKT